MCDILCPKGGVSMKHEWRKHEKELYGAGKTPSFVSVPLQKFIMINGQGNPNDADFSNRVGVLYSLAYAVKTGYKANAAKERLPDGIDDYTVYPLEGVWKQKNDGALIKEELEYTIMIRQPDFITEEMVNAAFKRVKAKKPDPLIDEVRFSAMQDGGCIEILHTGAYDDEPASFERMNRFAMENGLARMENCHREIYLNNAKQVETDRLRTILRYRVRVL